MQGYRPVLAVVAYLHCVRYIIYRPAQFDCSSLRRTLRGGYRSGVYLLYALWGLGAYSCSGARCPGHKQTTSDVRVSFIIFHATHTPERSLGRGTLRLRYALAVPLQDQAEVGFDLFSAGVRGEGPHRALHSVITSAVRAFEPPRRVHKFSKFLHARASQQCFSHASHTDAARAACSVRLRRASAQKRSRSRCAYWAHAHLLANVTRRSPWR